jgi:hypothetical protein
MTYVDRINPIEFEIKNSTDTPRSESYLVLYIEIDNGVGWKRNFMRREILPIVKFPFICSNIPAVSAYGVYRSVHGKHNGCYESRRTAYTSWTPEFNSGSQWGLSCLIFLFCVVFCEPLFASYIFHFGHCIVCPSIYGLTSTVVEYFSLSLFIWNKIWNDIIYLL